MQIRRDFLRSLEATIVGLFLVQSVRYLYAALFAHVSSADLVRRLLDPSRAANLPGYIEPSAAQTELLAVMAVFLAPLLALFIARTRWSIPLAVAICVVARYMTLELPESSVLVAAAVVAAGLFYLTLIAIRRTRFLPTMLAAGIGADQVIRALNSTFDPSFDPNYKFFVDDLEITLKGALLVVTISALLLTTLATLVEREEERLPGYQRPPNGVLTAWGALALGGILYLEFTILGMPNAAAHWAKIGYEIMLPLTLMATLLPLVPEIRMQASNFLSLFDGIYRGWLWALLLAFFIVIGRRFEGLGAGLTLALAQSAAILTLWWLVKQPEKRPRINPTPILILLSLLVFLALTLLNYFTFDYAYVRPYAPPFDFLSDLFSGMRGMGLTLALVAVVFACLPMILERQIIPWREGKVLETILTLSLVLIVTVYATSAAIPAGLQRPQNPDCLRIATFNIHGGYTQYFAPNLELVADTIQRSGADVALLQEVDAGRLTSGSMDQGLWLANRLNMNLTFFPQDEDLEGLAILSRLDVSSATGALLSSTGAQAGVQYATYRLDEQGDLHVYNVWLGFKLSERGGQTIPENEQDQAIQQDEIYRLVAANHFSPASNPDDRVILGGTFNYDEDSPLYQRWAETVLEDPFTGLFEETRDTLFLVDGTSARYDYIWLLNLVPSGINIDQRNLASDHRPSVVAVGRQARQSCPS